MKLYLSRDRSLLLLTFIILQGGDGAAKAQAQAQQKAKEADMRNVILSQALDQGARTRCV